MKKSTMSTISTLSMALVLGLAVRVLKAEFQRPQPETLQATVNSSIPAYRPEPATPRKAAGYVLPDGSIQVVSFDDMEGILESLNALFVQSHPGIKFKTVKGNNYSAMNSLTFDASPFAPMGSEFTYLGLKANEKFLPEPLGIRVAHASLNPIAKVSPLAIIAHKSNPIEKLTVGQVTQIFAVGSRKGDITHWAQLGVKGELASREIRPCGLPESDYYRSEDTEFGEFMSVRKMDRLHFTRNYEMMLHYSDVVRRVSEDPTAIGITALNRVTQDVKVVAIKADDWDTASRGSVEDIVAGKYPYDRYLYIYVRRVPGQAIDAFAKEYLRLVLSREGQDAIAGEAHGYLPLNPHEVVEELAKL